MCESPFPHPTVLNTQSAAVLQNGFNLAKIPPPPEFGHHDQPIGIACGLAATILSARVVKSLLYGLHPNDPLLLAASASLHAMVGIAATWILLVTQLQ